METSQKDSSLLPVSSIFLLLAALGATVFYDPPIKSQRPVEAKAFTKKFAGIETVEARLWKDPLSLVHDHDDKSDREDSHCLKTLARDIHRRLAFTGHIHQRLTPTSDIDQRQASTGHGENIPKIALLSVFVPSGGHLEERETRRRERIAVISGLGACGLVPASSDSIGYVAFNCGATKKTEQTGAAEKSGSEIRVPFEWFERDEVRSHTAAFQGNKEAAMTDRDAVLVLWIDETLFQNNLLSKLGYLMSRLLKETPCFNDSGTKCGVDFKKPWNQVELVMIGPTSTTTVMRMMKDEVIEENEKIESTWFGTDSACTNTVSDSKADNGQANEDDKAQQSEINENDKANKSQVNENGKVNKSQVNENDKTNKSQTNVKDEIPKPLEISEILTHLVVYSHRSTVKPVLLGRWYDSTEAREYMKCTCKGPPWSNERIGQVIKNRIQVTAATPDKKAEPSNGDSEKDEGFRFYTSVCRDDKLADALVEELDRRDVSFDDESDQILLLGEWDTFYGRTLLMAIEDAVNEHASKKNGIKVHRLGYLRSLGGEGGDNSENTQNKEKVKADPGAVGDEAAQAEARPYGANQIDYITRLEARLEEQGAKGDVQAIGVLGDDLYDKLLILQALRDNFQDALFFTTDLDAQLLHSSQYDWTRNLIVASSFGLEIHESLRECMEIDEEIILSTPPFRDCYQTSSFLACLLAFKCTRPLNEVQAELDACLQPRLFEVARSGALDITPSNDEDDRNWQDAIIRPIKWVSVILVILLFLAVSGMFRKVISIDHGEHEVKVLARLRYCAFFVFILFILIALFDAQRPGGEPMALLEGVSLWPTEFFRLLMVFCGVYFIMDGCMRIRASNRRIGERFFDIAPKDAKKESAQKKSAGPPADDPAGPPADNPAVSEPADPDPEAAPDKPPLQAGDGIEDQPVKSWKKWEEYLREGETLKRFWRVAIRSFLFIISALAIMKLIRFPHVPYRGGIAQVVDIVVLISSIIAISALTFFVTDATCICRDFVKKFSDQETLWRRTPHLKSIAARRNMKCRDLNDLFDVQIIAERTRVIGRLVIYPFLALFFLILSRIDLFDNWDWPWSLMGIFAALSVYAIASAVRLRKCAERARKKALERLNEKLCSALAEPPQNSSQAEPQQDPSQAGTPQKPPQADPEKKPPQADPQKPPPSAPQFRLLIDEVRGMNEGAFSPMLQNPVIAALLLPFGGMGIVTILNMLVKGGF